MWCACSQDSVTSKYRPLGELKRDMAQLDLLVETDIQVRDHITVVSLVTPKNQVFTSAKLGLQILKK